MTVVVIMEYVIFNSLNLPLKYSHVSVQNMAPASCHHAQPNTGESACSVASAAWCSVFLLVYHSQSHL